MHDLNRKRVKGARFKAGALGDITVARNLVSEAPRPSGSGHCCERTQNSTLVLSLSSITLTSIVSGWHYPFKLSFLCNNKMETMEQFGSKTIK